MKALRSTAIFCTLAMGVLSCAKPEAPAPFNVKVSGPAYSCSIIVAGQKITDDELLALAQKEVSKGRAAHIDADLQNTPYRCFGGVIFTLQRAGFKNIGYDAEPPAKP
jgi:hypothetical protein